MDFHIKPIQRQIQAHTFSLQKGFLAGPTAIKTGKPHVRRKPIQGEQLAGGEMIVRDLRVDGLHMLKIDRRGRSRGSRQERRCYRCESG